MIESQDIEYAIGVQSLALGKMETHMPGAEHMHSAAAHRHSNQTHTQTDTAQGLAEV